MSRIFVSRVAGAGGAAACGESDEDVSFADVAVSRFVSDEAVSGVRLALEFFATVARSSPPGGTHEGGPVSGQRADGGLIEEQGGVNIRWVVVVP
ncbi:hypothetical protein evm_009431 [Chilo suppressalis]|nr:hypothetical protein evm_009431 [Chilo suppressalis]